MEVEVKGRVLVYDTTVCCLECQYLHRPNPDEDSFLCLRSLEAVTHELDEPAGCNGFEEIMAYWVPRFVERLGVYA